MDSAPEHVGWDQFETLDRIEGFEEVVETHPKVEYVLTKSGIHISRKTVLCGPQNIKVDGKSILKPNVIIRADLAPVKMGKFCVVNERSVVRPPCRRYKGGIVIPKISVGDHVYIGKDCVVCALSIGSFVNIGDGAIVSPRCMLKDCCQIAPGAIVPPDTVVPPFTYWAGVPAKLVRELPDSTERRMTDFTTQLYKNFQLTDGGAAAGSLPVRGSSRSGSRNATLSASRSTVPSGDASNSTATPE